MRGLIASETNDIMLDKFGNFRMEYGAEALRQRLVNRILTQKREYVFDVTRGVDYTNLLFTDTPLPRLWERDMFDIIDDTPEINNILEWEYGTTDNKELTFTLVLDTIYGKITIKG